MQTSDPQIAQISQMGQEILHGSEALWMFESAYSL